MLKTLKAYVGEYKKTAIAAPVFIIFEVIFEPGPRTHVLELTRLYATDEAIRDGIDFYSLSDFSLVICKPDRKVIYSNCQWSGIQETGTLGDMVLEKVTIVAGKRLETEV